MWALALSWSQLAIHSQLVLTSPGHVWGLSCHLCHPGRHLEVKCWVLSYHSLLREVGLPCYQDLRAVCGISMVQPSEGDPSCRLMGDNEKGQCGGKVMSSRVISPAVWWPRNLAARKLAGIEFTA